MVAGKGSGRQRVYFCDQKKQSCRTTVRWVKQATSSWKLTYLNGTHENYGGVINSASLRRKDDVIEGIMKNDNTISGPKLKAAAQAATGVVVSSRSVQRVKHKLEETGDEQQACPSWRSYARTCGSSRNFH